MYNPGINVQCMEAICTVHHLTNVFVYYKDMLTDSLTPGTADKQLKLLTSFWHADQSWEHIIFASGGLLALHKCYWWVMGWH